MATTKATFKYKQNIHRKLTEQGAGKGTKTGMQRGRIKKYRGQGGRRKSVVR